MMVIFKGANFSKYCSICLDFVQPHSAVGSLKLVSEKTNFYFVYKYSCHNFKALFSHSQYTFFLLAHCMFSDFFSCVILLMSSLI